MPYLKPDFREEMTREINFNQVEGYFAALKFPYFLGALNYAVFSIVKKWLEKNGTRYVYLAGIVGTLTCCISEIYRRIASPYENKKIIENGDV